ncbi:hypothetical protein GCM10027447_13250 [Glycomyces halotolerans]
MNVELKKVLAVGAIGLFGLTGLAACGGEADSDSSGEDTDAAAVAEDEGAEETEASEAAGDGTSPDAPLPAGSAVEVGDWTITVTDVELDATETILAENEFNEPPADGFQQAMYTIEGTYNGDETGTLWLDVTVGVYADNTFYSECLNVVPGDLIDAPDVSGGGSASGASCAEIPSDAADGALVYIEDLFSLDGDKYYVQIA